MDTDDAVVNFVAITGASDSQATQMLEATNFDLSAAIDLFFAAGDAAAGGAGPGPGPAGDAAPAGTAGFEDDEALAQRLQK